MKNNNEEGPILRMVLAGIASVCAGAATHPIDTIKIRLQKEGEGGSINKKYKNIFQGGRVIIKEESILALYKGLGPMLVREATYSTLRLGLYEPFKYALGAQEGKPTSLFIMFTAGVLSGSTGALISNPFDLLKVRLQSIHGSNKKGFSNELSKILAEEGIKGLYKGLTPNLIRGAILTGTKMATYDKTKQMLIKTMKFKDGFYVQFVCSFITGLMLSITTAPMDLIKTRIMSQEVGQRVYTSLADCAIKTFKQEGLGAFYKGFLSQWIRFGPFNVIQLIVWEQLRTACNIKNI